MHIFFNEEEKKWLDMKPFHWTIKKGCPPRIKKRLEQKLTILNRQKQEIDDD